MITAAATLCLLMGAAPEAGAAKAMAIAAEADQAPSSEKVRREEASYGVLTDLEGFDGWWAQLQWFYPLYLDEKLDPRLENAWWGFALSTFVPCCGPTVLPWLMFEDIHRTDPGSGTPSFPLLYNMFGSWIAHGALMALASPLLCIPVLGWFAFFVWAMVNNFYLVPVAALNAYNREAQATVLGTQALDVSGGLKEGDRRRWELHIEQERWEIMGRARRSEVTPPAPDRFAF